MLKSMILYPNLLNIIRNLQELSLILQSVIVILTIHFSLNQICKENLLFISF